MLDENAAANSTCERGITAFYQTLATLDPIRLRVWADLGLTITQLRTLSVIRRNPGITVGELAAYFQVTPSSITGLVDRLATQGYIRREEDASDRRLVRHTITDYAVACLDRVSAETHQHMQETFDRMTAGEVEAFVAGHEAFMAAYQRVAVAL